MQGNAASRYAEMPRMEGCGLKMTPKTLMRINFQRGALKIAPQNRFEFLGGNLGYSGRYVSYATSLKNPFFPWRFRGQVSPLSLLRVILGEFSRYNFSSGVSGSLSALYTCHPYKRLSITSFGRLLRCHETAGNKEKQGTKKNKETETDQLRLQPNVSSLDGFVLKLSWTGNPPQDHLFWVGSPHQLRLHAPRHSFPQ